jgi:hypothetical protein
MLHDVLPRQIALQAVSSERAIAKLEGLARRLVLDDGSKAFLDELSQWDVPGFRAGLGFFEKRVGDFDRSLHATILPSV